MSIKNYTIYFCTLLMKLLQEILVILLKIVIPLCDVHLKIC